MSSSTCSCYKKRMVVLVHRKLHAGWEANARALNVCASCQERQVMMVSKQHMTVCTHHAHERTHTRTQHTRARANATALSALSCHAHTAEVARLSITTPRTTRPLAPTLTLVHSHSMSRHARPQTHTQHTSTCANSLLVQHTPLHYSQSQLSHASVDTNTLALAPTLTVASH